MADPYDLETDDLHKTYGAVAALRGLTLQVPRGSICGLLGRNGAGKSTALKVLVGLTHPTSGRARACGLDVTDPASGVAIRRRIAFVDEDRSLYDGYRVDEMIRFTAGFFPGWRRDLDQRYRRAFGLPGDRPVKALSRGMRAKLALLLAFCRGADVLILDEPTSGLDPVAADEVLQALVAHVGSGGGTVLVSSHQVADIEQVADRIAIVDRGQTVLSGELDDLRDTVRRVQVVFTGEAPDARFTSPGAARIRREGRVLSVLALSDVDEVVAEARALGPASVDVSPVPLKELFLDVVAAEA
ncbi:MAG: ABC transporter ATP-binding protein [Vicinamibacterales bacterium]